MEKDDIRVEATYCGELVDSLNPRFKETLRLDVDDHVKKKSFDESTEIRAFFPKEIVTLVEMNGMFEFLGYYELSSTKRLTQALPTT